MTERLYYTDALLRAFDATVLTCEASGDGSFAVVLDRTAFYPTSGGQPFDTGKLGTAHVRDVVDRDDGSIAHVTDAALAPRQVVHGKIDWARRFDHMQQHTGQHILSAAFDRLQGAQTVSFHLGAESATIDLSREVTPAEASSAERDANRVIWEDRPVGIRFVSGDEAAQLPLRKAPARGGTLRIVDVADYDVSACGGTHVPRAGMIGVIAVSGVERFKGGSRVTFVCGGRALDAFGRLRDTVAGATKLLSVAPNEIAQTVERLRADAKDQGKLVRQLQEEVAGHRAAALRGAAVSLGARRVVLREEPGWDAAALKTLAVAVVSEPGLIAIIVGGGRPLPVVTARSSDVSFDANAWMARAVAALGGKGGGRPELAQGGLATEPARALAFARDTLGE